MLKTVFESIQLVVVIISSGGALQGFISTLVWFACFPNILWAQVFFIMKREEINQLLEDWSRLELEFSFKCGLKRIYMLIYMFYLMMVCGSVTSLAQDIFSHQSAPYLISYYPVIRDTLTVPGTQAFHLIAIFFGIILLCTNDLVASFFYSHVGSAIQCLEKELLELFSDEGKRNIPLDFQQEFGQKIRSIWNRFEGLSLLVERANWLFGSVIFFSHGVSLFMISTLLYFFLSSLSGEAVENRMSTSNSFINMMGFVVRLIVSVLLAARVDFFTGRFRGTLTRFTSRNWNLIPQEDRDVLAIFLSRLQNDRVAACPSSLYYITLNLLLNVSGLVVSYVIILLQSNK